MSVSVDPYKANPSGYSPSALAYAAAAGMGVVFVPLDPLADDAYDPIQAAIDEACGYRRGAVVLLPAGNFRCLSGLRIWNSYVHLVGANNVPAVSTSDRIGTSIRFDSDEGGDIIRIEKDGAAIYGVVLRNIGIRATSTAASNKPNGVYAKESSEILLDECYIQDNIAAGVVFNGCAINKVKGGAITGTEHGVLLDANGTSVFTTAADVTLDRINFYENSVATVQIQGDTDTLRLKSIWSEHSPIMISVEQQAGKDLKVENIVADAPYFFNGPSSPYKAAKLFRSLAQNTAAKALTVEHVLLKSPKHWAYNDDTQNATHAIALMKNGNSNVATRNRGVVVEDGIFYGLNSATSAAVVYSDNSNDGGMFRGRVVALTGYQTGTAVALQTGSGSWTRDVFDNTPFAVTNGFRFRNAESGQAQTLDYYDEGTWTLGDASGATLSLSNVSGNCTYTRIGNIVVCTFAVTYPTTANGSAARWSGLPFAAAATANSLAGGMISYTDAGIQFTPLIAGGDTNVNLYKNTGGTVTNAELSGKTVRGTLLYLA